MPEPEDTNTQRGRQVADEVMGMGHGLPDHRMSAQDLNDPAASQNLRRYRQGYNRRKTEAGIEGDDEYKGMEEDKALDKTEMEGKSAHKPHHRHRGGQQQLTEHEKQERKMNENARKLQQGKSQRRGKAMDRMQQQPQQQNGYGHQHPAMPAEEPYSAQVLRCLHDDYSQQLAGYDHMMGLLEHEPTKQLMTKVLQNKASVLDQAEHLFGTHHADLPPLNGGASPYQQQQKAPAKGQQPRKDMDTMDDEGMQGASDRRGQEAPSGEEAFRASTKALPANAKANRKEDAIGRGGQMGNRQMQRNLDQGGYTDYADQLAEQFAHEQHGYTPGSQESRLFVEAVRKHRQGMGNKAMQQKDAPPKVEKAHHRRPPERYMDGWDDEEYPYKAMVGEAVTYLKDLSEEGSEFGEEDQMKAYHYHKVIDQIAKMGGKEKQDKSMKNSELAGCCNTASGFFKQLSTEKSFGDPHRKACELQMKALQPFVGNPARPEEELQEEFPGTIEEENQQVDAANPGMVGQEDMPLEEAEGEIMDDQIQPDEGMVNNEDEQILNEIDSALENMTTDQLRELHSVIQSEFIGNEVEPNNPNVEEEQLQEVEEDAMNYDNPENPNMDQNEEEMMRRERYQPGNTAYEPGEMGEKGRRKGKSLNAADVAAASAAQTRQLLEITESMNALTATFTSSSVE